MPIISTEELFKKKTISTKELMFRTSGTHFDPNKPLGTDTIPPTGIPEIADPQDISLDLPPTREARETRREPSGRVADIYGTFDVWAAPSDSQIWKSPGADFVRGFGQGWMRATQVPVLMGKRLPPPRTKAEKIGEMGGQIMEIITEFIGLGGVLRSAGLLSKTIPKGATAGRALQTGFLFGTQQFTEEVRKGTAEAIYDEDFGTRGGIAVLESIGIGAAFSLVGSGIGKIWQKLKPSEQAQALKTLGLKKGASLHKINKASHKFALKFHPDKVKGMRAQFDKVIAARDALRKAKTRDVIVAYAKQNFKKQLMGKVGITGEVADVAIQRLDAGESITKVDQMLSQAKLGIKPLVTAVPKKVTPPPIVVEKPPSKPVSPRKQSEAGITFKEGESAKGRPTLTALKDGEPVGKIIYEKTDKGVKIQNIDVIEEYRRQGIGTALVEQIKERFPGKVDYTMPSGPEAKAFLEKVTKPEAVLETIEHKDFTELESIEAVPTGKGAGTKALQELIGKAEKPIRLTVAKSNTKAQALYKRLGFKEITPEDPRITGVRMEYKPIKAEKVKLKGKLDVTPLLKSHRTFMRILEPSKAVEMKLGKEPYATVIKGIHQTDVGRIEFNEAQLVGHDKAISRLGEWFNKFSDKDLRNLMLSRGQPTTVNAELIQQNAINNLPKELRGIKVRNAIEQIANFNYAYLQKVAGDDINKVVDYFYGIYKEHKKVDRFLDYWRTTKRFTKEKKLPTVADAVDYGLELRNYNPVENLKAEYLAIAHLEGMTWMRDELMRTGKGKFIDETLASPLEWEKVHDPVFRDLRLQPDLAHLINNLIATNKLTKVPTLNALRQINNTLRTVKFIGSAFHLLSVAKQSVADSGYLGFLYKPTATRWLTRGFTKNDPIFRTTAYKDYIRHGGGHRYSVEGEAARAFNQAINELDRNMGAAVKAGALPLKIPTGFVNWMFQSYIPKVKYSKFLDVVAEQEKKLNRKLTSPEKIDIIKEQQNFYGMMNERLFGRSGTVTTALRFYFMSPGYAEGNYRTMLKAATQWGGKGGFKANRSRSNIINSWLITGIAATVGTLAFTGKPPKKPEELDDARDLFKIDTGKKDEKGRRIMIDLMTYDKDYWNVAFNTLRLRPDVAVGKSWKRIGGMKAPTAEMLVDLANMSMGRAIYDWKGDRVVEITDPFLRKAMKLTVHEVKKLKPISVSVYEQSRKRDIDKTIAAVETLLGLRPTKSEKDIREQKLISKMYSLRGQREELSWHIGKSTDPKKTVDRYNKTVNGILESPYVPKSMKDEWGPKLLVDYEKVVTWKRFPAGKMTDAEMQRAFDAHTLSVPYKRRGEPFRPIGAPKKGSEQRIEELKAEAKKRGIELKRGPRRKPRR